MTRLFLALILCTFAPALRAQVIINEVSAANMNGIADSDGDREDWVELYNTGASTVNLSGWFLSDNPAVPQKWVVPTGQTIAAGAYRIFYCSGKDKVAGAYVHTNFKITQTKTESVVLTQPNGTTVDTYTYATPNQVDHSYGRSPNGGLNWKIFTTPTPGFANTGSSYQSYGPAVTASLEAGFYPGSISVGLSSTAGFEIRYTTNGSEPTTTSPLYAGPVNIAVTTVLKARAFSLNPQILPGFVTVNTYFINVSHTIPVISISGDNVNTLMAGSTIRPYGAFEYFENNTLIEEAYGEFNKHGNDSWAYPQRGIDWVTRDQTGYKDLMHHKFFAERTRTKFQRVILKAAANDNYPSSSGGAHVRDAFVHTLALHGGLDVDVRTNRFCILYVNGQYWGVYDMREKVDDADFTSYYYDQEEPFVDYIKTWGNTWSEYGTSTDWYALKSFILSNDMAIPANYNYVLSQFDLLSLVDYVIINQHSVCKDWLNWNTSWWRGRDPNGTGTRWRYALWDMDATFGHYINYTGIPDPGPTADPCDVEDIPNSGDPQNHIDIFVALYNNPEFKSMYINRYADLLNTSLSCAYMNALLDTMVNEIAPEMTQHCARWGGNTGQWNQHVSDLHAFINTRCQLLDQSIVDCYSVTGPFGLTVNISPAGSPNQVMVNTVTPTSYPFVGEYFGDIDVDLVAKPAPGWIFDHWEVNGNTFGPNQFADAITLAFQTTGVVTAFFIPPGPCNPPAGVAIANPNPGTSMNWNGQSFTSSYVIRYRAVGAPAWTQITTTQNNWNFDSLPGCTDFEMQIQSVCPQGSSTFTDFNFSTPDHLAGFALSDASICNSDTAILDATVSGANYLWDDGSSSPTRPVNAPGQYWVSVNLNGCTKTDTMQVSQVVTTASVQSVLCPGETFVLGNVTFSELNPGGQVVLSNMASGGCDSIVNVSLTYLSTSQTQLFQTSCSPADVGVDTVLLTNAVGCDSMVITSTSLAPFSQTLLTATTCNLNLAGTDTLTLVNQFGCDSLVITTTTLTPISQTFLTASSCNPALVGVDTLLLSNQYGCDSLVITATAFDPSGIAVTNLFVKNCDPAAVGTDTLLLSNAAGCDSLVITTTSLAPTSQTLLNASSCNPALLGTDTLLLFNQYGCDSLVITTTVFDPSGIAVTSLAAKTCNPAAVGVDTLIMSSVGGCDSLVVTTTTLAPMSQTLLAATSCNPALLGTDTLLLSNQFGCDSLVITTTTFSAAGISVTPLWAQSCNPAAVGVDTVIMNSVGGCDSLVVTTTTLAPASQSFQTANTCNPAHAGTDTLLMVNQYGCDSLVITTTTYTGLDFTASAAPVLCFGENNGAIRIDTVLTPLLPVKLELENHPVQYYSGAPTGWNNLPAGIYAVSATNPEGCTVTNTITVNEADALHLDLGQQPLAIHTGDSIWVEPTADFLIATAEWLPQEGVQCPDCPATFLSPLNTTNYTLTVYDANGCPVSARVSVAVEQGVRLFVGNAIRPGGDGPNAELTVYAGPEVARILSFQLYDRWGNRIFEQKNLTPNVPTAWDGTFNGKLVHSGVILWVCTLETIDGQVVYKSGDITVLR